MKKLFTLFAALFLLTVINFSANAQIVTVSKDPTQKPDYKEIQNAIDSAANGSTIYVYPGNYNGFTITNKHFNLVGPGYFLDENPQTQVNQNTAAVNGFISLNLQSDGTIIQGFNLISFITVNNANNILFKKNKIYFEMEIENSNNINIRQNFISRDYWHNDTYRCPLIGLKGYCSNIVFENNILSREFHFCACNNSDCRFLQTESNTFCIVKNNILYGHFYGSNIYFENNILRSGENYGCTNCFYTHNISYDTNAFGNNNGNIAMSMNDIFVGTGSTDGKWQIKSNSPAKGTATDGGDPGMFGGLEPYVLSGMPSIPSIYYFQAPSNTSSSGNLPIQIKIKSH